MASSLPMLRNGSLEYEAVGNIVAGTEACANVLLTITYHLNELDVVRERLVKELQQIGHQADFATLKQLPYLVSLHVVEKSCAETSSLPSSKKGCVCRVAPMSGPRV